MTTRGQLMLSWGRTRPLQQSLSHPRSQNPHVIAASSAHRWQHRSGAAQPAATLLHSSPSLAPWRRVGALPAGQLDYWDVVEYQPQTGSAQPASPPGLRLGLVQQVGSDAVQLSPLIEEDEGVWVPEAEDAEAPEQQERVPLGRVLRIVETVYGQRQDKEHNPHGEHAHDVWQVVVPLSPGVFRGQDASSSSSSSS